MGRIAALVPEFAVKDLPLARTLMMMMMINPYLVPRFRLFLLKIEGYLIIIELIMHKS